MKVGDPSGVTPIGRGQGTPVLNGPGWSVIARGEFLLLRALPVLTGGQVMEVSLTEAQMRALRDGDVTVEDLIQRDASNARSGQTQVSLSDAAQRAAQAGLISDPQAAARKGKGRAAAGGATGTRHGAPQGKPPEPRYDHRLTLAALVLAAAVFLFILFGS